jgi:hypothetical protein
MYGVGMETVVPEPQHCWGVLDASGRCACRKVAHVSLWLSGVVINDT